MTLNQSSWGQYGGYYDETLQPTSRTRSYPSIELPGSQLLAARTPTSSIAVQDTDSDKIARSNVFQSQDSDDDRGGSSPTGSDISSPGSTSSDMTPSDADEHERAQDFLGLSPSNMPNDVSRHLSPSYMLREYSPSSMVSDQSFLNFHSQAQHSLSPALSAQSHTQSYQSPLWQLQTQPQQTLQQAPNIAMQSDIQYMPLSNSPNSAHTAAWSPFHPRNNEPVPSSMSMWELNSDTPQPYHSSSNGHSATNQNYTGHQVYDGHAAQYPTAQDLSQFPLLGPIHTSNLAFRSGSAAVLHVDENYTSYHQAQYNGSLMEGPGFVQNTYGFEESASSPGSSGSEMDYSPPGTASGLTLPIEEKLPKAPVSPVVDTAMLNSPSASKSKKTKGNPNGVRKAPVASRAGGRKLGTHLNSQKAAEANEMRKVGACWRCTVQRDKCDPNETCRRCLNRAQRPGLPEFTFGCCRDTLPSLLDFFRPRVLSDLHGKVTLETLCQENVAEWDHVEIPIQLTCGRGLPWLEVKSYEFKGRTQELLRQFQYSRDKATNMLTKVEKRSPPLGITQMNYMHDEGKYDTHVRQIASTFMDNLVKKYYAGEKDDFSKRMFQLLVDIKPRKESEEEKILKDVFHLIITTYILSRTFTIVDEVREDSLSKMKSYRPGTYQNMCSPRMANRQIKHFFSRLHEKTMNSLLNRLQQTFRSSKGCDQWVAAFTVVLGLAIAFEVIQKNVHTILDSKWSHGDMPQKKAEEDAVSLVAEIDRKFEFIMQIFQSKYARTCNPLKDCNNDWSAKIGDMGFLDFMKNLNKLINEKKNYMQQRVQVGVHCSNWTQYTGRLCSKFLLSFL